MKNNYYIGIDLGTTNTVMSYGRINPNSGELDININEISAQNKDGGMTKIGLLPSCVYFKQNARPIIGPYAKGMLATQGSRVVSSIKSQMGKEEELIFDENIYNPEDISSLILKYIAKLSEKKFKMFPDDVVITVPASFSSDQKKATLKAAENAGFKVKNDDGTPRNILLDEPRAALFNFVYEWKQGKIPTMKLDEKKNFLVFDLGGGTLDVSLHELEYKSEIDKINIKDYAISRYTQIGGDNFDKKLADYFLAHLIDKKVDYDSLDGSRKEELDKRLISLAENVKIEFNTEIMNELIYEEDLKSLDDYEVMASNIYDNKGIDLDLDLEGYQGIISELLGENLKYDDYKKINDINFSENDNIIYPILDVLAKAKNKLGKDIRIDGVLLNGGMSKLYFIQKRLEDFFGFKPITEIDEDKAVAFGASYYHYTLHQGITYGTIQNESIGIEIKGDFVHHLVNAGEELPYESEISEKFDIQEDGATTLLFPFYLGERTDKKEPNKKIASRRVIFDKALRKGDRIALKAKVNEAGLMELEGWKLGDECNKFKVEVASDKIEEEEIKIKKIKIKKPRKEPKTGLELNIEDTIIQLKKVLDQKKIDNSTFKNISNKIKNARNGDEFINILLNMTKYLKNDAKSKVIILLGDLIKYYDDYREYVTKSLIKYIHPDVIMKVCEGDPKNINRIIKDYVNTIGKGEQKFAESSLLFLFGDQLSKTIKNDVLIALGKTGYSKNTVKYLMQYYNDKIEISKELDPQKLLWSLGKLSSREKENPIDIEVLYPLIDNILESIDLVKNKELFKKLVYLVGEISDLRFGDAISDKYKKKVLKKLNEIYNLKNTKERKFLDIIISMVEGNELNKEQEVSLLAIRTTL
ncbi:MAG: Hsp70 family protein [Psychrilyobacter sp.]|uniref:Hsp70 family protein n=1 Tax=Psychrilyobacter sp. TaxID=2586924 RepID=UPI003C7705E1